MTISDDNDLARLKEIGRIVANTLEAMGKALEPGMTTSELDRIGRTLLEAAGARSAPELAYDFPGATCISINEQAAHGIPSDRVIRAARRLGDQRGPLTTDIVRAGQTAPRT